MQRALVVRAECAYAPTMTDDAAPFRVGGNRRPSPQGPKRYWNDVPPDERATAENDLAWRAAQGRQYPFDRGERMVRWFFNEHRKKYLRILAIPDRCQGAVPWYSTMLWYPCNNKARGHGLCWIHGGWKDTMPTRSKIVEVDACEAEPQAEVTLRLSEIRLDSMTRQLGKLKRAAENMGAPGDATVHLDSYGDHTLARVKWQA